MPDNKIEKKEEQALVLYVLGCLQSIAASLTKIIVIAEDMVASAATKKKQ